MFRHFFGEGVDPSGVRRRVGHIDISVYVHTKNTTDDEQKGVLGTMGEAFNRMIAGAGARGQSEFVDIEQRMLAAFIAIGMSRQEAA